MTDVEENKLIIRQKAKGNRREKDLRGEKVMVMTEVNRRERLLNNRGGSNYEPKS